ERYAILLAACTGASACVGVIGDGDDGDAPIAGESSIGPSELRRLSQHEYEASLRDLFGDADIDQAQAALDQVPKDDPEVGFSTMENDISAVHVDGYYAVADALAELYATDTARLAPIAACFGSSVDAPCVEGFVRDFGRRVFRRPPSDAERTAMMDLFAQGSAITAGDGVRLVLLYMLQAPPFLYRLELDGAELEGFERIYELTDYELAARLSYFAWGSTPDVELLDAAASGALATDEGFAAQVERLFASDRAAERVESFFGEWLGAEALPQVQQPPEFLDGIDGTTLADDMKNELMRFIRHHVFEAASGYGELMRSDVAFIKSPALAQVYGVPAPGSADEPVSLGAERSGVLTRAALLLQNGVSTHPIQRGARLRRTMLCEVIKPPDPNDFPPNTIVPPAFDADKTARERWTEQTSADACAACHSQINPFGFALEHFDTIGRYRELEPIIDPSTNSVVNELPIDANVSVPLDGGADVAGAQGLGEALATSDTAARCFARQWFRYTAGRMEEQDDREVLDAMNQTLAEESMLTTMKRLALTPQFKLRRVKP
ncbi:MAG TPA: DUF1592 domain-containing protein, partial [Polyangiaceae bacterium]|nr:DUF1592 domain-containing protein [Polyangiaceae bacterium]